MCGNPFRRWAWGVVAVVTLALLAGGRPLAAQESAAAKTGAAKKSRGSSEAKPAAKPRGRLPAFYAGVVDDQQRQAIYQIQQEYEPQVAALKAQLEALSTQRDAKIAAVLTPEQREKIAQKQAAAKGKRPAEPKPAANSDTPPAPAAAAPPKPPGK